MEELTEGGIVRGVVAYTWMGGRIPLEIHEQGIVHKILCVACEDAHRVYIKHPAPRCTACGWLPE
jgi:hypothetical protein